MDLNYNTSSKDFLKLVIPVSLVNIKYYVNSNYNLIKYILCILVIY